MELNFENLIDRNEYQVFLMKSRASFPFVFAIHPWFVISKKGEISRWEVAFSNNYKDKQHWGHLYKNLFPLFQGIELIPFSNKLFAESKLIDKVEGEEAIKMINFIENSSHIYSHLNEYKFKGPNSNTYVQWVINNFPESKLSLPINAFGKNYL